MAHKITVNSLTFRFPCVESGVELCDPWGSLPTQNILFAKYEYLLKMQGQPQKAEKLEHTRTRIIYAT